MLFSSPQNQLDKGREAMKYFHNQASKYSGYALTFDQMLDAVGGGGQKTSIFLEGLGLAIDSIGDEFLGGNKVENAMENLADQGQGKLPANRNAFFSALSGEAQNVSFIDASKVVAVETGKELLSGAQAVGDSVITTFQSLGAFLPLLVVGAVAFIVISKARKVAA